VHPIVIPSRPRPRTLLVATDLSDASTNALDHALQLASALHAAIVVVHAYQVPTLGATVVGRSELAAAIASARQVELGRFVQSCDAGGTPVETVLRPGRPEEVVAEVAAETGAALIVVATHARRRSWRALRGSMVARLQKHSSAPVLSVPEESV
jgi:nucleotide-binding universal stress UspA family protein